MEYLDGCARKPRSCFLPESGCFCPYECVSYSVVRVWRIAEDQVVRAFESCERRGYGSAEDLRALTITGARQVEPDDFAGVSTPLNEISVLRTARKGLDA